ncbi:hypothetical protein EJD97_015465 [Solanum chilense]|uniref:Uncharacterized protein n=1 Tax=Solanum chilense TaxID=4083 RepID=A0A6N2AEB3_SOLCI|nr:hypothetical protein EJD97_015465 [Solanum chilense]
MNDLFSLARSFLATSIELIVFGKMIMLYVIHRYSLLTSTSSYGMRIKSQRCLFAFASLREVVILVVGCDTQGNILSSTKLYQLEEEK